MQTFFLLPLAAALVAPGAPKTPAPPTIGAKVTDFTLDGVDGRRHSLGDYKNKKAVVIVFVGNECPISKVYMVTLAEMHQKYSGKGVAFLAINSNDQDTFADVVAHAKERPVPFPVLKDEGHVADDAFGARRTPEAFLLDSGLVIRYHGRIDDQYGYTYRRAAPTKTELKDAIEDLLAGKPVATPETRVEGCIIGRTKKSTPRATK
jgi:peroxiredoxin